MSISPRPRAVDDRAFVRFAPFADLTTETLEALNAIAETRSYEAGETIAAIGQFDDGEFLFVEDGRVTISRIDEISGAMLVDFRHSGDCIGLVAAILSARSDADHASTLIADGDVILRAVDAAGFRALVDATPDLTRALMMHFAGLAQSAATPAAESAPYQRVYAVLLDYAEQDPSAAWRIAKMPKHREIADRARVCSGSLPFL